MSIKGPTEAKGDATMLTASAIQDKAQELGFDAVGFACADDDGFKPLANRLDDFLARNYQGDMGWMANHQDRRQHPKGIWPDVRSIISLGMNYGPNRDALALKDQPDRGMISVYAQGSDYHDLVKKRLKQLARWMVEAAGNAPEVKVFVDTAPVMEKPISQQAGLGWQGKHTNLVSKEFGSWLFLGEIFTTIKIEPSAPMADHCGSCDACLRACPTDAFPQPYRLDATRCVSYLTIEHKGPIDPELMANMGNHIYGCDDCLAACPWTKFSKPTEKDAFMPRAENLAPRLSDLAKLDDAAFRALFRGSPIKRTGRDRFLRNVIIAIGNSGNEDYKAELQTLTHDKSELVRDTARWALDRLALPPKY